MEASEENFDCCIVGIGLAGLSTAWTLVEEKRRDPSLIYMIEARDRVGGRTHTELIHVLGDEDDSTVDVGGQWVGEIQHRVLGFIERLGLELKEQYYPHAETKSGTGNHQPLDNLVKGVGS